MAANQLNRSMPNETGVNYYYERNRFVIDEKTYVDMVCLTSDKISIEGSYKKKTYSTLVSYSEEIPLENLDPKERKELEKKTRIELNLDLTSAEYEKFSQLEGKQLLTIKPSKIESYEAKS